MQDVAGTIFEGAVAFIRRQYTTIGDPRGRRRGRHRRRHRASSRPRTSPTYRSSSGLPIGGHDGHRLPRRRRLLDGLRDHRHVHQRQGQRPHGSGGPAQPRRGGPGRDARRRRLRLPRRRPVAARRVGHLHAYSTVVGDGHGRRRRPFLIVGFGFGASFVALFAQLGGGIYTKAADVGSDLVGKVEKGIPEDDPRNAGVIADLVGDNVGDCAGRGADLFESTAAENIGAMILGVASTRSPLTAGWPNPEAWIFFPLVVRAFGLLATIVAIFFVRGKEDEDPMNMLNRGYWVTTLLSVVGLLIVDQRDDADQRRRRRRRPARPGSTSSRPASSASRPASPSSTSPSTTRRARSARSARSPRRPRPARRRTSSRARRSASRRPFVTAITIGIALFASHWLGYAGEPRQRRRHERRRHLRDRRRDDGHADDHRLHPGDGHLRPDHRQRRRHRRVQPRRGRRPRDHRPPRRRRQHDQGADQGLRDRLGVAGRVPAVQRLHRQGQPHPGPAIEPACRRRAAQLGQPRQRQRLHRGAASARCWCTSSARWRSARSARRPRRSSSRSAASSARCPGSWTTPSARTTPGSSTSRPAPRSAR